MSLGTRFCGDVVVCGKIRLTVRMSVEVLISGVFEMSISTPRRVKTSFEVVGSLSGLLGLGRETTRTTEVMVCIS